MKAKNLGGAKPKATLRVDAGSDQVKKVRFKVPKSLRFTDGSRVRERHLGHATTSGELDDDVLAAHGALGDGRDALAPAPTC